MDPSQRPSSDELLNHTYIHSARMAQFIKDAAVHADSDPVKLVTRSVNTPFEPATNQSSNTITTPTNIPLLVQRSNPTMKSNSQTLRQLANHKSNSSSNVSAIPTPTHRQRIYAIDTSRSPADSPTPITNKVGKKESKYSASVVANTSVGNQTSTLIPQSSQLRYKKRKRESQQQQQPAIKSKTAQVDEGRNRGVAGR